MGASTASYDFRLARLRARRARWRGEMMVIVGDDAHHRRG
jgi:hypothetical protein